ncbi:hypothetical protein [Methyloferula stellata]|uniref:hypothetical protein n=1 Tax=Methyloferula stellata TaxID=876270 RepID=UPI00037C4A79|nr:hypothetical protein [Methyloferula stellata]
MTSRAAKALSLRPYASLTHSLIDWALILLLGLASLSTAAADPASSFGNPGAPALPPAAPNARFGAPFETSQGALHLTAVLTANDPQPIHAGLKWRVFNEATDQDQSHKLVAESSDATPTLPLPDGAYIVHAGLGLAGVTKRVVINGQTISEKLVLNAGGLRIVGLLGDVPINPTKLSIAIYVPERGNSEAKLVFANAKAGDTIGLPEGNYHVVSTLLDTTTSGSASATNSVVGADLRVQAGKLTDTTLRHRAAVMTLKLVGAPGGEAMANTAFTILTPGGDVIRELIGAFPSLVLAEGEYVAIARHDNKTYQTNFKVTSTLDRDVEVIMK